MQIFKHGLKSYRDLLLRLAEFGVVYRYEPSGAMHGLIRVRGFTQDEAHVPIQSPSAEAAATARPCCPLAEAIAASVEEAKPPDVKRARAEV